ncbi:DUF362 domain-containing protein, partial [Patescibacteria group bacterium]|nr:DUF362 domain-containing protein [Patescibacteria group bacterium]
MADTSVKSLANNQYYKTADKYNKNPNSQVMGWYAVSEYVLDADVIVNISKLKVHSTYAVTSAIKNHVGSAIYSTYESGRETGHYDRLPHFKTNDTGNDLYFENDIFWRAILDMNKIVLYGDKQGILQSVKQRGYLNVIDGIETVVAGDHAFPKPKNVIKHGVVLASEDPVAVSAVAARTMGYDFRAVPHINNATGETAYKIGINDPKEIVVLGDENDYNKPNPQDDHIDNTFNNIFETGPNWGMYANSAGLKINDFDPPEIVSAQKQNNNTLINITAQINNSVVAFVRYNSSGQQHIQKMQKSGNNYSLSISVASSDIEIIAQDEYFNTSSSQASDGGNDPNNCVLKQKFNVSSDGTETESTILSSNVNYKIKAEGAFYYWYPSHPNALADAECSETTDHGKAGWNKGETDVDSGGNPIFPNPANHDLTINGQNIDWGQCKTDHIYTIDKIGTGSKLKFKIQDSYYLDNQGFLKVSIYECGNGTPPTPTPTCWDDVKGHCYPRTGALHWESSSSDWDSNFDLLIIPRGKYVEDYVKKVKAKNPHIIILPTCDINQGECLRDEEWKIRKSDGSTIKIYGGGSDWVDYTDFAPQLSQYDNKRFNEYIGTAMARGVDLNIVDGFATDGFWITGWSPESDDIDIDRNGINDYSEHNKWWVQEQIKTGALHAMENIKNALSEDKYFFLNPGFSFKLEGVQYRNGQYLEHYKGPYTHVSSFSLLEDYQEFMKKARKPHLFMLDASPGGKENYQGIRFMLGITLLGDGYFSNDDIYNHHGVNWYDEMSLNIGYPTEVGQTGPQDDARLVPNTDKGNGRGVYARFFDKGVSLVSVLTHDINITDNDLQKLEGYNGPYYKFKGGQDNSMNNGQEFTAVTLKGFEKKEWNNNYFRIQGDGIILTKEPTTMVSDIYINNGKIGTSPGSKKAEFIGNWTQVG